MKNWIKFTSGVWIDGKKWEERGIVYIDPHAVVTVAEMYGAPHGSVIHTVATLFTVRETPGEVISQIQSALS